MRKDGNGKKELAQNAFFISFVSELLKTTQKDLPHIKLRL